MKLEILEPHCEWTADAVKDPALWTEWLTPAELAELDAATKANAAPSS